MAAQLVNLDTISNLISLRVPEILKEKDTIICVDDTPAGLIYVAVEKLAVENFIEIPYLPTPTDVLYKLAIQIPFPPPIQSQDYIVQTFSETVAAHLRKHNPSTWMKILNIIQPQITDFTNDTVIICMTIIFR